MIPKFIELISNSGIKKYVNVNTIHSITTYNETEHTLIKFVGELLTFRDKRTPEEILNLINGTETQLPTKTPLTFPRKMLVGNYKEEVNEKEVMVLCDLGENYLFRYVCTPLYNFYNNDGVDDFVSFKFAEEIK